MSAMRNVVPVLTVLAVLVGVWYAATVWMNAPWARDQAARAGRTLTAAELVADTMAQSRPVLPAPHQVAEELWRTTALQPVTSRRSLVRHAWITLSSALLGFAMGAALGVLLAVMIVHSRAMDLSLMPWIVASQTIPILALAPMIIVVLNAVGVSGLMPKALISTYLAFFPVAVGMTAGLRAPERLQLDLMRTYGATGRQVFLKLRWPTATPYLFASLKVAVAASLVGAIVAELPTGAVAGLGARLLSGSYYGQTVQIWSALFMAAIVAGLAIGVVSFAHRRVLRRMGMSA
jgi:NitT/TauT family transport system permease protein